MSSVFRVSAMLLLLTACLLSLQAAPAPDAPDVTIVVNAPRLPGSDPLAATTVISGKAIEDAGAQTVADALRLVPGLIVRQYGQMGALATASIRGCAPDQVLVLVDGRRISSPAFFFGADLEKLPVNNVARIEVIRGPVSSLYGSAALGGVINIITRAPAPAGGSVTDSTGTHGRSERAITVNGVTHAVGWRVDGAFPAFDGERPNSAFTANDLTGRADLPALDGWQLTAGGEHYDDSLGLPGADIHHTGFFTPNDHQWWTRDSIHVNGARDAGSGRLEMQTYYTAQALRGNAAAGFTDSLISGATTALDGQYHLGRGPHDGLLGAELRAERYRDREGGLFPSDTRKSAATVALYAQDQWAVRSNADLLLGLRYDHHSVAGGSVTPRAGITALLAPDTHLRFSYAEGFRAPNFAELYAPVGALGAGFSGNPALQPERSRQFELGAIWARGPHMLDAALFTNRVHDMITATPATPYANIGRARQQGLEIAYHWKIDPHSSLGLAYTYLDARDLTTDTLINGIPHNTISLTAARDIDNWNIALSGDWLARRPDLAFDPTTFAASPVTLSGAALFDLSLTHHGNPALNPYLVIRNLTNQPFFSVAGYPAEGRSLEGGVRVGW